jgi:non-heme Fe2+,alpha-ketoglutarate-dependent halogenase
MKGLDTLKFHAPRTLSREDIAVYERDGLLTGFDLFGPEQAPLLHHALVREVLSVPLPAEGHQESSPRGTDGDRYIDRPLIYELCTLPQILNPVRQILGNDVMLFRSQLFYKPAHGLEIPWHQESYFWRARGDWVTLWLAIDEARSDNGAMRVVPGSHSETRDHLPVTQDGSYWPSFTKMAHPRDSDRIVECPMRAGQFMLFGDLMHSSLPNKTASPRLSFTARYARPDLGGIQDHFYAGHQCVMVSGEPGESQLRFAEPPTGGAGLDSLFAGAAMHPDQSIAPGTTV